MKSGARPKVSGAPHNIANQASVSLYIQAPAMAPREYSTSPHTAPIISGFIENNPNEPKMAPW